MLLKAVKWNDLYYSDNRRVVVERADFRDFQNCMQFNQQHARQIEIETTLSSKYSTSGCC